MCVSECECGYVCARVCVRVCRVGLATWIQPPSQTDVRFSSYVCGLVWSHFFFFLFLEALS